MTPPQAAGINWHSRPRRANVAERERQILACIGSGQHDAQACRVAWHGGKGDGLHKDAGIEQLCAQEFGALGLTDHDGCNGRLRAPQVKAKGPHALLKKVGIVPQLRDLILGLLEQCHGGSCKRPHPRR